jgi:tetraprenyl-beta-curcumene synthase
MPPLRDRRTVARAGVALAVANARFWPTVWPVVRAQLRRWERRAARIEDPELRALALEKLRNEPFNAEVAATLATLAPKWERRTAIEGIVALEVLYDYLDGLTERQTQEPVRDGEALFGAFTDAISPPGDRERADYFRHHRGGDGGGDDGGYLEHLSRAVEVALARLPAAAVVRDVARQTAEHCAQAQIRIHAATTTGSGQLESWARSEAAGGPLEWRELLAGRASSVLAVHAMIAAAADPRTTHEDAVELADAYLLTCVLITVLDSLVDYGEDMSAGVPGFVGLYEDRGQLAATLADIAGQAASKAAGIKDGAHHVMTLAGVVAYYTSAPGARSEIASPASEQLQQQLRPLIIPTLAVMRSWRLAKRASGGRRGTGELHGSAD